MHGDDEDRDPWDRELGEVAWLPGVDYVGGWTQARELAQELRAVLIGKGAPPQAIRTGARTGEDGAGTVEVTLSMKLARYLTDVLRHLDVEGIQACELGCGDGQPVCAGS